MLGSVAVLTFLRGKLSVRLADFPWSSDDGVRDLGAGEIVGRVMLGFNHIFRRCFA